MTYTLRLVSSGNPMSGFVMPYCMIYLSCMMYIRKPLLAWRIALWALLLGGFFIFGKCANAEVGRSFPSVFMAWAEGTTSTQKNLADIARHDLVIVGPKSMGLGRVGPDEELSGPDLVTALAKRRALKLLNSHIIILVEVRYFDAGGDYLDVNSAWWRRDKFGVRVHSPGLIDGIRDTYLLDFGQTSLQRSIAEQCRRYVRSGVFDGCMFDWWGTAFSDVPGAEGTARLNIIKNVRETVGDKALIVANVNDKLPFMTAAYLNGVYMEGFARDSVPNWRQVIGNLRWLGAHLRAPKITALEGWYDCGICKGRPEILQAEGRSKLQYMRSVTTLSLTNSDGYVLFSDPNVLPTSDHMHDWYSFWNKTLGFATSPKHQSFRDGSFRRAFTKGCAVFNPVDNRSITLRFVMPHLSLASGLIRTQHVVGRGDGDIFVGRSVHARSVDECH